MSSTNKDKHLKMRTLYEIQGGCCAFCGGLMEHPDQVRDREAAEGQECDPDAPTLEHVVPKAFKGSNQLTNLLLAHRRCNEARGVGRLPWMARTVWKTNLNLIRELRGAA